MEPSELSGALRTVLDILDAWEIPVQDRLPLLGCDQRTYDRWVETRVLLDVNPDTLERLSYILGIWKALHTLLPEAVAANTWIKRPNKSGTFRGQPPLAIMVAGGTNGLALVRRYLDGWIG